MLEKCAALSIVRACSRLAILTLIGALALIFPAVGEAQLVLYDDFKGKLIDPENRS